MNSPYPLDDFLAHFQLQLPRLPCHFGAGRQAAVLVPVVNRAQPGLLLTRRARSLRNHAGQVAFPGGMRDETDRCLLETALREAQEEIALPRDLVRVIGQLPTVTSSTGFQVIPYLGIVPADLPLSANKSEVESIFEMPLQLALDTARYTALEINHDGQTRRLWFSQFDQYLIWGMTAGIIRQLSLQVVPASVT
ncbi:NUDIX domain-containing protein [Izhakiella capsodis]|uniref:NUDIX domain-containing protein n=1 Tax=Izhakiella capsodis TaxID=1367852 RepID=A0A1I4ZAV6_9GAMM|nr:CoA pyrophosphatase [Izhakiella capsodis]SFN47327.1 NUDIX domain-containing protein [Izhakiella capsodis]